MTLARFSTPLIIVILAVFATAAMQTIGIQQLPDFSDYEVEIYNGPVSAVDLSSHKDAKMFRTRLRDAAKGDVNFGGHFILTFWGCGTSCQTGAIIDAKTGAVYFPDELRATVFSDLDDRLVDYRTDSTLIIVRGHMREEDEAKVTYLVWENGSFKHLSSTPLK